MKCDETKPSCQQCIRKKVNCPGYIVTQLQWSAKHEKFPLLQVDCGSPDGQEKTTSAQHIEHSQPILSTESRNLSSEYAPTDYSNFSPRGAKTRSSIGSTSASSELEWISNLDLDFSPDGEEAGFKGNLEMVRQRLQHSSVPGFLIHMPTVLVDHYFDCVCVIFSSFDTAMNPFRAAVGRLWHGWEPIYYTIQSMAAAYLANDLPHLRATGIQLQAEAYRSLQQNSRFASSADDDDKTLLTIIMLGLTTSWHQSNDLGIEHLTAARNLVRRRSAREAHAISPDLRRQRQNKFYEQCLLYWEMHAAFVTDISQDNVNEEHAMPYTPDAGLTTDQPQTKPYEVLSFPHPWTGVAPTVMSIFTRTGVLIRRTRQAQRILEADVESFNFTNALPLLDIVDLVEAQNTAQILEDELLNFDSLSASELVDTGDTRTPLDHFLKIHECYRCAALLLIYRVFPDILTRRLAVTEVQNDDAWSASYFQSLLRSSGSGLDTSESKWLSSLAIYVLKHLEDLPMSSGTRFLQPILILVTAPELRFPAVSTCRGLGQNALQGLDLDSINIAQARRFATARLNELQVALPSKPQEQVVKIIRETWDQIDNDRSVFWMDVMSANGWETMMG